MEIFGFSSEEWAEIEASLPAEQPARIEAPIAATPEQMAAWSAEIEAWLLDEEKPNPFTA